VGRATDVASPDGDSIYEEMDYAVFFARLEELISRTGTSQAEVEKHADIPKNTITKWKTWWNQETKKADRLRRGGPPLHYVKWVARELGVTLDYLTKDVEDDERPVGMTHDEEDLIVFYRALGLQPAKERLIRAMAEIAGEIRSKTTTQPHPDTPVQVPTRSTSIDGPPPPASGDRSRRGA
jgi:transposase